DAIRPAQHGDAAIATVCLGGAASVCWLIARHRDVRTVHIGAASVVLALVMGYTIIDPNLGNDHAKASNRIVHAAVALRQTLEFGAPHALEDAVASVQAYAPRGARIGFWGESAGKLDFRRNSIIDLTQGEKRSETMAPMTVSDLRHVDYVL